MKTPDKLREKQAWLLKLAPGLKSSFDTVRTLDESSEPIAPPLDGEPVSGVIPDNYRLEAAPDAPVAKGGYELDVISKSISKDTKHGKLELTTKIKLAPEVSGGGGSPVGSSTNYTNKSKDGERKSGVKQRFSYQDFKNLDLLKELKITDISAGVEGEWSGTEISASGTADFTIQTPHFNTKVKGKFILFRVKEGEGPKLGGVEIKVEPAKFKVKIAGVETSVIADFAVSYMVDPKKVGAEIIEKIAKDKLKKEAEKQGVKMVGRQLGSKILARLGPLATAFQVGWIIGTLLSKYTVAGEVALTVDEDILGDLNERYQKASTLGKIGLVVRNLPRITAALIASGFAGAVTGMGEVIVFKLLGLDRLSDFVPALKEFNKLRELIPNIGEAAGDMILSTAIKLGIKLNPKYSRISNPALAAIGTAIYTELKPVFKKKGGLQVLISMTLADVDVPASELSKAAKFLLQSKINYGGMLDLKSSPETIVNRLLEFRLQEFLGLLESNKLIQYKIKLSNELSLDSVDQNLVDEVFL